MLILADNDILFTLGTCNLLHELPDLFGITPAEVLILPWTRHYLRRSIENEKFLSLYSYEGIERAIAFADSVSLLDASLVDEQVFGAIVGLPRMDIGEATLLSALPNLKDGYLVTGDKACLQTLAEADQCKPLWGAVKGCVYCLDQVVLLAMQELGYMRVRASIAPVRSCNGWFSITFSGGLETSEAHATAAFESAIREIRSFAPDLLYPIF